MRSCSSVGWQPVDEWDGGFGWMQEEFMQRASHALLVDGRVWLVDPVDGPELEVRVRALGEPAGVLQLLDRHERGCAAWAERLGAPHLRAWETVGEAPFEVLPVRDRRWWHEVALWEPKGRTLVSADALGTVGYFCAPGEPVGLHPLVRPFPPRALARVAPERILGGHGPGLHDDATAALQESLRTARRRLPAVLLNIVRRRGSSAARA
jgi:hypothetical protein